MIRVPAIFKPTHQTAGLEGFPAIDIFGDPYETITAGFTGKVMRISGRPCSQGGTPGGAYGQSLYIESQNGDVRYLTHLARLFVKVGDRVSLGTELATLCNSKESGKPGTTHVHYGLNKANNPIPVPPERLYDVVGPKGRVWHKHVPASKLDTLVPPLVKKLGNVTVRNAAS